MKPDGGFVVGGERRCWAISGRLRKLVLDRAEVRPQLDPEISEGHLDVVEGLATDVSVLVDLLLLLLCDLPDVDIVSVLKGEHGACQETDLADSLRERRDPIGAAGAVGSLRLRLVEDEAPESARCLGGLGDLDGDDGARGRRRPHELRHVGVLVRTVGEGFLVIADSDHELSDSHLGVLLQGTGVASVPVGTTR